MNPLYLIETMDGWSVNDTSYRSTLDELWAGQYDKPQAVWEISFDVKPEDISERVAMDLMIRARDEYSPIQEREGLLSFVQMQGHMMTAEAAE